MASPRASDSLVAVYMRPHPGGTSSAPAMSRVPCPSARLAQVSAGISVTGASNIADTSYTDCPVAPSVWRCCPPGRCVLPLPHAAGPPPPRRPPQGSSRRVGVCAWTAVPSHWVPSQCPESGSPADVRSGCVSAGCIQQFGSNIDTVMPSVGADRLAINALTFKLWLLFRPAACTTAAISLCVFAGLPITTLRVMRR